MRYSDWKRRWFRDNFSSDTCDWLYFPDSDTIICYEVHSGMEVQMSGDYLREYSRDTFRKVNTPLTTDQKLDKIIKLLEKVND